MSLNLDTSCLMDIVSRPEVMFVRGRGSWLEDHTGKRYLDFVQGWAVNCLGHCPPEITEALKEQAGKLITPSPAFFNEPALQLAKFLTEHSCFDEVFFTNSGAEANEGAIKLARKWGRLKKSGAFEIITFANSFHGRTLATMSASGKAGWDTMFAPQVPGFKRAQLNDIESVQSLITDQTVAIMLEPVQGEAGVIVAEDEFLQALRSLCDERKLLLIVDEVQAGIGRCGRPFCYQWSGVTPDIMTLGKGIGGGVPLGALLARREVSCFEYGEQGGTYNGNPLMAAVGLAVVQRVFDPAFLAEIARKTAVFQRLLQGVVSKYGLVGERGRGLLRALVLDGDYGPEVVKTALHQTPDGLLLNSPRPYLLRFMPSLNIADEELHLMVSMLDTNLAHIRGAKNSSLA